MTGVIVIHRVLFYPTETFHFRKVFVFGIIYWGAVMKIYLLGEAAFIELTREKNYMLCIGTKAEVDEADEQGILRMVEVALAHAKYRSLTGREAQH